MCSAFVWEEGGQLIHFYTGSNEQRRSWWFEIRRFIQLIGLSAQNYSDSEYPSEILILFLLGWDWLCFWCWGLPFRAPEAWRALSSADILDATRSRLNKHALNQHWQLGTNTLIKIHRSDKWKITHANDRKRSPQGFHEVAPFLFVLRFYNWSDFWRKRLSWFMDGLRLETTLVWL